MRRSSGSVGIGGVGGSGGFNKPPPVPPLSHGSTGGGRIHLNMPESTSPLSKDRFGPRRECSSNMSNSLPLSPSHPNNREKTSNPTFQDLHDSSMCLSAYIQSLNTVCGTACRLAQCLAQVASENASYSEPNAGHHLPLMVKEAADLWEGIARAVGVASAAAKTQIIVMLQEVQSKRMDCIDQVRKQELVKHVVQTMLSTFLNLHYQFSAVVIDRFTGLLQQLMEDSFLSNNPLHQTPPTMDAAQHPSPPPSGSQIFFQPSAYNIPHQMQHSIPTPSNFSAHQLLMQQQKVIQQQAAMQQLAQMSPLSPPFSSQSSSIKSNPSIEVTTKDDSIFVSSRRASSRPWSGNPGSPKSSHLVNSSLTVTPCHGSNNTLSPSFCSALSGVSNGPHEWSNEAIIRRWSMGGPSADGWPEKNSSLTPFSLIANRRWSVPEANEHDPGGPGLGFLHPFYSSLGMSGSEWNGGSSSIGSRSQASFRGSKGILHAYHDGSSIRSPSHSRSVTPEQINRCSDMVSSIIDLLSLPLSSCNSQGESCQTDPFQPNSVISHVVSESPEMILQRKHFNSPLNQTKDSPLRNSDSSNRNSEHLSTSSDQSSNDASEDTKELLTTIRPEYGQNEKNTPLWPPTETVPGVTLTECSGDEEKPILSSWSDEKRSGNSFSRDSPSRASWPVTSGAKSLYSHWGDETIEEGTGGWPPIPAYTFRRHSTDAPFFLPQTTTTLAAKTRSVEDIAKIDSHSNKINQISTNYSLFFKD